MFNVYNYLSTSYQDSLQYDFLMFNQEQMCENQSG